MIGEALTRVVAGETLSRAEMSEVIRAIMQGEEHDMVVAALLTALRQRGETNDELAGAAQTMRELAVPLPEAPAGAIDT